MAELVTTVSTRIESSVTKKARMAFCVAVADGTPILEEELTIAVDGGPLDPDEILGDSGSRTHVVIAPEGELTLDYRARVTASTPARPVTKLDKLTYLRPSRYSESDRFGSIAAKWFAGLEGQDLITAVGEKVHEHLRYVPGTSKATDSALDTLLGGQGVCRDYTHLTVALLRARGVPARATAVYAPGLNPMDFHAVAEVAFEDRWQIIDATRKAPRQSLIRVATGRDAADNAFSWTISGATKFRTLKVNAVVDGDLPVDDHSQPVYI